MKYLLIILTFILTVSQNTFAKNYQSEGQKFTVGKIFDGVQANLICSDKAFSHFEGNMFLTTLGNEHIHRIVMDINRKLFK